MKKLLFGLTAALLTTVSFGQTKESNVQLAFQKTLMVGTVEMFQRGVPAGVTAEDFNKQLVEGKVSTEGRLFLNKAFLLYKKGTSTREILTTYDGKESKGLMIQLTNGGVNPFGDLTNPANTDRGVLGWLIRLLIKVRDVVDGAVRALEIFDNALNDAIGLGK